MEMATHLNSRLSSLKMFDNASNGVTVVKESAQDRAGLGSKEKLVLHWAKQGLSERL